jgi:hypothetical protein
VWKVGLLIDAHSLDRLCGLVLELLRHCGGLSGNAAFPTLESDMLHVHRDDPMKERARAVSQVQAPP